MNRAAAVLVVGFLVVCESACATARPHDGRTDLDLGLIPIGSTPKDLSRFVSSDCFKKTPPFADCSATDTVGRQYAFFDGALSKVSASKTLVAETIPLLAGIKFGSDITVAAREIETSFGIKLTRAVVEGALVYSSGYTVRASTGVLFSIELSSDHKGKLIEVVERTDF